MRIGAAQIDITPPVDTELSGFVARRQPALGVHDPLWARAVYIESDEGRFLWIHADLVGFDRDLVRRLKRHLGALGLEPTEIQLSATHTHSGPATVALNQCGEPNLEYLQWLEGPLEKVAVGAMRRIRRATRVVADGESDLAVDRRDTASRHTDPRIGLLGWRTEKDGYVAVVANYPMHNVALGPESRLVSADVAGRAAVSLSALLPGAPVVLWTNGACANLNPPSGGADFARVRRWGDELAERAAAALAEGTAKADDPVLRTASADVEIPLAPLDDAAIDSHLQRLRAGESGLFPHVLERYRAAIDAWEKSVRAETPASAPVAVQALRIDETVFAGIGAEVFSSLTDELRAAVDLRVCTIGYANGLFGYVPPRLAFDEGGYEVDGAFVFYGTPPTAADAGDVLRDGAIEVIRQVADAN